MSSPRAERILYALLVVVGVFALGGIVLLLIQAESYHLALFELTAFSVSVLAVMLAVLGSIASIHQTRAVRKIAKDIRGAVRELKDLDRDTESIKRKLRQEYALSRVIAQSLAEAGIIEDDSKQQEVAGEIERKIRKKTTRGE